MESSPSRPPTGSIRRPLFLEGYPDLGPGRAAMAAVLDLVVMAKGGITVSVVFTAATGVWLAPGSLGPGRTALFLVATGVLVAAANMLNCWIERDADGLMRRTRNRPLPAGRLDPWLALATATALAALALPLILLAANALAAVLGFVALATYVAIYTPLKRHSPRALEVGGIPGAIPPLMGWAAVTGTLDAPAWALFGILYFWQLPHFIAIALWLEDDYARGGMQVLPVACGESTARRAMFVYTVALVAASLVPVVLGLGGPAYAVTALVLGGGFLALSASALPEREGTVRARRVFFYSLIYQPALLSALVLGSL